MEVKNLLYAGLGIGNKVSKKSYEAYKNFIESGKKADPQVSSTLENFFENMDDHQQEVKDKMVELFDKIADKLGYVKIDKYEALQKHITNLEADLHKEKTK